MRFAYLARFSTCAGFVAALTGASTARAQDDQPPITVRPHLEGARGLRLEQKGPQTSEDDESQWTKVCDAPCDRSVPVDGTYRVAGGPGITPSGDLHLRGHYGERVLISVDRTTTTRRETGKGIVIGGAVAVGAGVLLFTSYAFLGLVADLNNGGCAVITDVTGTGGTNGASGSATASTSCHSSAPKSVLWTGVGVTSVGVAALVAGLVLMTPTSAHQAPLVDIQPESEDRWTPPPQVNGPASLLPPPGPTFSVLSGTF